MPKSRPGIKPTSVPVPVEKPDRNLREDITRQARLLWRSYGEPKGRDFDIWLEAERQVLGADPSVRVPQSGQAVSAAEYVTGNAPVAPPAGLPLRNE